jgi:hypothetical protein
MWNSEVRKKEMRVKGDVEKEKRLGAYERW